MATKERTLTFNGWIAEATAALMARKSPPKGIDDLRKALINGLPKYLTAKKSEITKSRIFEELDVLFWKGRTKFLRDASESGELSPAKLLEILKLHRRRDEPLPPLWVVEEKFREMHGRTPGPSKEIETLRGILRMPIKKAKDIPLIESSFMEPYHALADHADDCFDITLVNAPQVGLPYDADIYRNLFRSGLSAARKGGSKAIIIGGGMFHIPLRMSGGPNQFLAALASGETINSKFIAKEYREEYRQITESDEIVPAFVTAFERFASLLDGLNKVAVRPGNRPEYDGTIYVVLGEPDVQFYVGAAAWEFAYERRVRLLRAQAYASVCVHVEKLAHKNLVEAEREGRGVKAARKAYETAREEFLAASAIETRIRANNYDKAQMRKAIRRARSFLTEQIETYLPNAKVLGLKDAHIILGKSKHVTRIVSAGGSMNPFYELLHNYGPTQRAGLQATCTVVMHNRALYPRTTSRENYLDGKMLGTDRYVEAPMLVDPGPIRERTRGMRINHPTIKAVNDPMFVGGMTTLHVHPDLGVTADFLTVEGVRKLGEPRRGPPPPPVKRCYGFVATDRHFGGSMAHILTQANELPIPLTHAVFHLIRRDAMSKSGLVPLALFFIADDILHGNHFGTERRPHYNKRPAAELQMEAEEIFARLEGLAPTKCVELLKGLSIELLMQILRRPPDYLTGQFEELFPFLRANTDVFRGMLLYAKHAGVSVRGVSEIMGRRSDTRDLGLINFGSGNHFGKTTQEMLQEGPLVAEYIRAWLSGDPALAGMNLDRLVRAPMFQNLAIGYATLQVANGYTWGIHMSSSPPKRDSWIDTLHGWVQVNRQRGNPSTILDRKSILHICGDKHFSAGSIAGGDLYMMGSSATHTDGFAEIAGGLTENTAGVDFVGIPVDGPDSGEIRIVHLTPAIIQDALLSSKKFPWDELLRDHI